MYGTEAAIKVQIKTNFYTLHGHTRDRGEAILARMASVGQALSFLDRTFAKLTQSTMA